MKDKNAAGILALFLGWVGVHRFYLGQVGLGVLYAVFCWFPLTWLIAFIDAIVLFSMDKDVFDVKYNKKQWQEQQQAAYNRRNQPDYNQQRPISPDFERRKQTQAPPPQKMAASRPNPHKQAGLEKFKDFDYTGAIEAFKKSLEIAPQDVATHFNLACAYALVEEKDLAFSHLDKAVQLGFNDFHKIKEHHALAYLRIQKEFDQFENNGFRLGSAPAKPAQEENLLASTPNLLDQLKQLSALRDKGLLTEQEFEVERQKLMAQ